MNQDSTPSPTPLTGPTGGTTSGSSHSSHASEEVPVSAVPGGVPSVTDQGDVATRPIPEPQVSVQANSKPIPAKAAEPSGYGFGQIFMVGLTLVGIVLVAQGLRRKSVRPALKNEFSEIDAIRRELAAKYPVEPRAKPVSAQPQQAAQAAQTTAALQELAERLSTQLDAKAARIEALISEADRKISELKELASPTQEAPLARLVAESHRSHRATPAVDPLHQRVYDMSDAGMVPVEIARSVQQPTGHVELILNLRAAAQGTVRKVGV